MGDSERWIGEREQLDEIRRAEDREERRGEKRTMTNMPPAGPSSQRMTAAHEQKRTPDAYEPWKSAAAQSTTSTTCRRSPGGSATPISGSRRPRCRFRASKSSLPHNGAAHSPGRTAGPYPSRPLRTPVWGATRHSTKNSPPPPPHPVSKTKGVVPRETPRGRGSGPPHRRCVDAGVV